MPFLMLLMIAFGMLRGVKIYEAVTDGAKQGFDIALRIIPYLVAILVAIGMFRASGAMELFASWLSPITTLVGMPADVLPLALTLCQQLHSPYNLLNSRDPYAPRKKPHRSPPMSMHW